ncbi:hypothetical protein PAEAM_06890 [Paenibacillus sp. GM1FR]|nr:hypothetical protein PAEAM_06890 [Paenibacillus sp. GM1FR]
MNLTNVWGERRKYSSHANKIIEEIHVQTGHKCYITRGVGEAENMGS